MKITYLFGAGASCHALPIVNQIPDRLNFLIENLKKNEFGFHSQEQHESKSKIDLLEEMIQELRWLRDNTKNHASIDTFAKKLYLKNKDAELKRLRISLSIFLVIEQLLNPSDKRYDAFFASILDEHYSSLPENIRILSWNYDSQFEKSYAEYSDDPDWERNRALLRTVTKYSLGRPRQPGFRVIKLNGSHNIIGDSGHSIYNFCSTGNGFCRQALDEILRNYAIITDRRSRVSLGLSFAWEKGDDNIIEFAKQETIDTEILIVIGYSFPYFNRNIDRAVIKNMISLKKVYFQSPEASALKERFATIRNDVADLVSINDVNQFYLPDEL